MTNPDVCYYKLRIDSFGPSGEEGVPPSCEELEMMLERELRGSITPSQAQKGVTFNVEVALETDA